MTRSARLLAVFMLLVMGRPASGQTLAGDALVKALRQGGYILVMRHASSPREVPNTRIANGDNVKLERHWTRLGVQDQWRWVGRYAI